jgi:hypothetical protein
MLENLSLMGALTIMLAVIVIGELVARVSQGKIPSPLVISILMIAGFWTVFPKDIAVRAGVNGNMNAMAAMLLITNLSTLISRKEMAAQWRTIVINLLGLAAIIGITLGISANLPFVGWNNAVAATPPLAGGVMATMLMQQEAAQKGLEMAALVALICFVMQGIAGYPLTSICLGREAKRLNKLFADGKLEAVGATAANAGTLEKESLFTKLKSPAWILAKLAFVAFLSYRLELLITVIVKSTGGNFTISRYVWCLVLGFIAREFKFLERDALTQANAYGLTMNILLIGLFGGLNTATPAQFWPVAGMCLFMVAVAAAGMAIMAFIASKIFKTNTFNMCYSIILTAFYGFPVNVMLTTEAVEGATDNKGAQDAIRAQILPKMLVGGFTSVTVVSVVLAGFMLGMFK